MGALIYQAYDNGDSNNSQICWYSAGVRPIYSFNKHLALALELGADWVDSQPDGYNDILFKATLAPELRFAPEFFARPVLRAYVTYAAWGSGFEGLVGGDAYANSTEGLAFGLQAEAWW